MWQAAHRLNSADLEVYVGQLLDLFCFIHFKAMAVLKYFQALGFQVLKYFQDLDFFCHFLSKQIKGKFSAFLFGILLFPTLPLQFLPLSLAQVQSAIWLIRPSPKELLIKFREKELSTYFVSYLHLKICKKNNLFPCHACQRKLQH